MLEFAFGALVVALVAWALGFTGIARGAATLAKLVFILFLVIAGLLFGLALLGVGAVL